MKGIDLNQFQFDYDLTWAAFFLNADGTIYGRYGTRSVAGAMAHNSMSSLKNAMTRALELHRNYPANQASLAEKRGSEVEGQPSRKWKTPLEIPGLRKRFGKKLLQPTGKENCIHCHNIHDGWHDTAYDEGTFDLDSIWIFPLPSNIGMSIDVDTGVMIETVTSASFAARVGIQAGDVIHTMNGQPIISIADMQWVLHNLPKTSNLAVEVKRGNDILTKTLSLSGEWKKSDISWRASFASIRPHLWVSTPELSSDEKEELGLATDALALKVRAIYTGSPKKAGLKVEDVIVEAGGQRKVMTRGEFQIWIKFNYGRGDKLPIKVLRENQEVPIVLSLW